MLVTPCASADTAGLTYRTNDLDLGAGDTIYLYTDGVTEAMDGSGELFGVDRLRRALEFRDETDPEELLSTVSGQISSFVGGAEQSDDITMLGLRINLLSSYVRVPAVFSSCEVVSDFVGGWLAQGRFPSRFVSQVMVVQDEAFSNVMRYAYKDATDIVTDGTVEPAPAQGVRGTSAFGRALPGEATVELSVDDGDMVLRLIDAGVPFDPLEDTTGRRTEDDDLQIGGDGITLIKGFMDDLAYGYVDGRNVLTMRKHIPTE